MSNTRREFKPREPYTRRLYNILKEYPDGSQVLREILQNSDDAKSTEQIFILDHNTYPSNSLLKPDFDNNYTRTNLKLDRYQGPALLARNNTIFEERDFQSLLKLADSEKHDQFDKIGVMGVGFNSIYHITDSPSFITGDNYVILDPHEWYFNGGVQYEFGERLVNECPDQFAPFKIPCDKPFEGTIFRYPLRTNEDSIDSKIIKKVYKPEDILEMFHKFYERESINCLLFLKYIESIHFYELKEGATEPELLYTIQLDNAVQVRQQRRLIVKQIVPMMKLLQSGKLDTNSEIETSYVASFSQQQKKDLKETTSWLILNYLDDLHEAEAYFQEKFHKSIGDNKFIPNVGLAVPLNDLNSTGRLFCFLPLPQPMPFSVSVHGYFAVSTNRRSLWSATDNEDLAPDSLARLKVTWNQYLFEQVLPKAWVKFLRTLPLKVANIQSNDLYKLWPIIKEGESGGIIPFCKDLLQNVIKNLDNKDRVFKGPSSLNTIGVVSNISEDSYDASSFEESEFHWLSLFNGYLKDEKPVGIELPEIIGNIGFPVISTLFPIVKALKDSRHMDSLHYFSPSIIRTYLRGNGDRWQNDAISRNDVLYLFEYILDDKQFDELEGFKMIPLADGKLGTLTNSNNSYNSCVYIDPDNDFTRHQNDECNIFTDQLNKFIDKSIKNYGLYYCLYGNAKAGWNLNIKILNESAVAEMIILSLKYTGNAKDSEEIEILNRREWIHQLWDNLEYRNWDLTRFEDIHLIPTSRSTLRKLNTPSKIFSSRTSKNNSIDSLVSTFERFGAVFVSNDFEIGISKWDKVSPYIIKPDDIISVLDSFQADISYPENLKKKLPNHEVSALVEHLSNYLRLANKHNLVQERINVIQYLPIFTEVDDDSSIPLLPLSPENKKWYLLPQDDENSYGKIIYPSDKGGFLSTRSKDLCYILEDVIKIPRLTINDYWRNYVIPFLESQSLRDIDIVVDKLFDRLPSLLDHNANLKDVLGNKSFIPAGTLKMSQQQEILNNVTLAKPMDLFDPEEKSLIGLFFEDERVFPAGKYGIPKTFTSKFLSNLRLLGVKSILTPTDIISRIDTIATSNINEDLVRSKALSLFKYIDDKWDRFTSNDHESLKAILEKEWIPTIDESGKKSFSKPRDCYCEKYKDLVCFVAPVLEHNAKNRNFLEYLNWHIYPDVETVLRQLDFCRDNVARREPQRELKSICNAIYNYMSEAFKAKDDISREKFDYMKQNLENKSWILYGNKFYSSDKIVINLPSKFPGNDSLIVELPIEYKFGYKDLFKSMGVRDEVGIKDLILIIKNLVSENEKNELTTNEISNVIVIIEQIAKIRKDNKREGNNEINQEELEGLLIPSNKKILVDLRDIHFDDLGDRLNEKDRNNYAITHYLVTPDIAEALQIQTLRGTIFGDAGDMDWDFYEQNESLTTRIKNIIKDYSISSLFKEFLQNADDAKAKNFLVIVDERPKFRYDSSKKPSFFSEKMEDWQGPAVWIYNDAEFSPKDFQALIKLGIGGKSSDDTKIGKFGIGFNCAFHITDLPSFVSGKYIAFLDPHAKFLPPSGYPLKKPRGIRIDFIEKEFKEHFPDQCYPYKTIFDFIKKTFPDKYEATGGCDFSKEFKGTLFRLPLRTSELASGSDISKKVIDIKKIKGQFNNIEENNELLFLRNIESCSLYWMKGSRDPQLIWKTKVNIADKFREYRQKVIDREQIYQLDIERINYVENKKVSEIWAICTGGHGRIRPEFKRFSEEKRLRPRGGVASLLAQSYSEYSESTEALDELRAGSFPNPPELTGRCYCYLSLPIISNLGVHLNGDFSLSSARSGIIQSENAFLQTDCDDGKWNCFILNDILSDLHVKLLDYIVDLEKDRRKKEQINFVSHTMNNLWPIPNSINDSYRSYGLNVIKKLGLKGHKIFWTDANNGRFISLKESKIFDDDKANIVDLLVKSGVSAVKLDADKNKQLNEITTNHSNFPYEPINGKLICLELQIKKFSMPSFNVNDSLLELVDFILQDKRSFEILTGLPLVPLNNGSVGKFGEVYYIVKQKHLSLFPQAGPSRFVHVDLPESLLKVFNDNDFTALTNIKKFDASAVLELLKHELPFVRELEWDPNGENIPNNNWLKKIWKILLKAAEHIDFNKLSIYPLLPMIEPSKMLICLNMEDPLLYIPENGHTLYSVLVKLKVRFTDLTFPENAHENLNQCVVKCTPINIINALGRACSSSCLTMEQLFDKDDLEISDYENIRRFVKAEIDTLIGHGESDERFMEILRSLPIWPIHSSEEKFIDATSGSLLKIPFFSFYQDTDFYKCDDESDLNTLTKLGAPEISVLEYVKHHIIPPLKSLFPEPSQEYITFLQKVLSLKNKEIEQCLKPYQAIPNQSATSLVKADTLYDINVQLFSIFDNTDKFLPQELQSNNVCLEALGKMGLKRQVDCNIYIECAQEIESQVSEIQHDRSREDVVKERAKNLVRHLYDNINTLNFNSEQWNKILKIRFVPSEKNLPGQFYQNQVETSGFETFENLCSQKYKKICWTQCPLFDENIEPTTFFNEHHPELGVPSTEKIIEHWFVIEKMSKEKSWTIDCKRELKSVIKEIYDLMNEISKEDNHKLYINLKTNDPNKKIFLNGDDPFNEGYWVAGKELVFGLKEDIKEGMYKVKDCLMDYEDLLIQAGARKVKSIDPKPPPTNENPDQKDVFFNSLLDKLINQSDIECQCHDVIFIVGEEKVRIGASRYVLSAVSNRFKSMFCGGFKESLMNKIEIPVEDVQPDVFQVLLRWLYGQSFEDATISVLRKTDEFTEDDESYEIYYLSFLVNLLKVTDFYRVEPLKDKLEDIIISDISVANVCEIQEWSRQSKATRLEDYCERYIKENRPLVLVKKIEGVVNAENEQVRLEEKEMLDSIVT